MSGKSKIREILLDYLRGKVDKRSGLRVTVYTIDKALLAIEKEIGNCFGKDSPLSKTNTSIGLKYFRDGRNARSKEFWSAWKGE